MNFDFPSRKPTPVESASPVVEQPTTPEPITTDEPVTPEMPLPKPNLSDQYIRDEQGKVIGVKGVLGGPGPIGIAAQGGPTGAPPTLANRAGHMLHLYWGLLIGFLFFYALASWTAYTSGELSPGQVVFNASMTQLWTASYRLAFVLGASLLLLRIFWPALFEFFRSDRREGPDLDTTLRYQLSPTQRLWFFYAVFFALCVLFVMLLLVKLEESASVGQ